MTTDLRLTLHGGPESLARVFAHLHKVGAEVEELHMAAGQMCVHLADASSHGRVAAVLDRLVDVVVVSEGTHTCVSRPEPQPWLRTRYAVNVRPRAVSAA